jgi:hypothetical protein
MRQCLVDDKDINQDGLLKRKIVPTTSKHAAELDTKDPRREAPLVVRPAVEFYLDDYESGEY